MVQLLHFIVPTYVTFEKVLFGESFLAAVTLELFVLFWRMENYHVPRQATFVLKRAFTLQTVLLIHSRSSMAFSVLHIEWFCEEPLAAAVHESSLPVGLFEMLIQLVPRAEGLTMRSFIRAQATIQFELGSCSSFTFCSLDRRSVRIRVRGGRSSWVRFRFTGTG